MQSLLRIALLGLLALPASAHAVGQLPTPALTGVQISADVAFDALNNRYTYSYSIANPAGSIGEITEIRLDVTAPQSVNEMVFHDTGLTIPLGPNRIDFSSLVSRLKSLNSSISTPSLFQPATIVPFGQNAPLGWSGGLGMGGYAGFTAGDSTPGIFPGGGLSGFQLVSFGVPTVRQVHIVPFWMHVVDDHESVTEADMAAAGEIERSIVFQTVTLGASGVGYGSFAHWDQLRDDLARAIQLGWIIDKTLGTTLTSQLAFARE